MLRIYFKYDRALLTKLCRCAYDNLLIFLQNVIGLQDGTPGVVLSIHTFGDYPEKFHPHIHAIVADGLFRKTGTFYVMPDVDLKPLEEIFRAKVFNMLKEEGKIDDDFIHKLMNWKHSGFSVHNKARVARDDEKGREALAQYIIRNTFSLEKIQSNLTPDDQPLDETDEAIEIIDVSEYQLPETLPTQNPPLKTMN